MYGIVTPECLVDLSAVKGSVSPDFIDGFVFGGGEIEKHITLCGAQGVMHFVRIKEVWLKVIDPARHHN